MQNRFLTRAELLTVTATLSVIAMLWAPGLVAQTAGQKTFVSSKEAVSGFIEAVRANNTSALQSILGADSEAIVSSGDEVADKTARNNFLAKYDAKHTLVASGQHQFTLNVGTDGWPLPIPLVDNGGKWYFDGA